MIRIESSILLKVPRPVAFDAERNISLHASTQGHRQERAVSGVVEGLIELGEEVEWEAVHFGLRQRMRVRITEMERPLYFRDEMIAGAFRTFSHQHYFEESGNGQTLKKDVMIFSAPCGILGWLAERIFLGRYMRKFLERKNADLKRLIEGEAGIGGNE